MSEPIELFHQWREQIAEGATRETLQSMRSFLKGRVNDLHNETILRLRDVTRIDTEQRKGTATAENLHVKAAQLDDRVLGLIDAIESKVNRARDTDSPILTPFVSEPVTLVRMPDDSGLEKIIGANNLKRIDWLRVGLDRARSICRITTPFNLGTGFLLPGGMMLTNHHVLPAQAIAEKSFVEFNVEEDLAGKLSPPVRYELDASTHVAHADLDCCLIKIKEDPNRPPLADWGTLVLETIKAPTVGEHVTIIQHPAGGPKQIALTANQVVNLNEFRLQYATDTMPGSSGSPVFNDDWKVVALHHKGGNIVANGTGAKIFANEGILMADIQKRLGL